jgi:hypothetical protein
VNHGARGNPAASTRHRNSRLRVRRSRFLAAPGVSANHEWAIDAREAPSARRENGYELGARTELLEHIPDWEATLTNLRELTASGGRLALKCPAFYAPHEEPQDLWRPTEYLRRAFARVEDATAAAMKPDSFLRRHIRPSASLYLSNLMVPERPRGGNSDNGDD